MTLSELATFQTQALAEIAACKTPADVENCRIKYIGRNGSLPALMKGLRDVPPAEKPAFGQALNALRTAVTELSDEVAVRLRKHALKCTTVQVTIRDPNFKDICRQKRLSAPTYVSRDLTDTAMELIRASWTPKAPVRALTITAQNLVEEGDAGEQLNLFAAGAAPRRDRLEKLEKAMDGIRDRFGRDAITAASTVHRDKAEVKEDHRLPPVD